MKLYENLMWDQSELEVVDQAEWQTLMQGILAAMLTGDIAKPHAAPS